jgi:hypothetical protein
MSYDYQTEKQALLTEDGQVMLLKVRDRVHLLLKEAGAFRASEAWQGVTGSSWTMLACLDRLVELGEIKEAVNPVSSWAQNRIFVANRRD